MKRFENARDHFTTSHSALLISAEMFAGKKNQTGAINNFGNE
jgi:hypothetical protein